MGLKDIDSVFQNDTDGASTLFETMRTSVHTFSEFYEKEILPAKDATDLSPNVWREYAFLKESAQAALEAYRAENDKHHYLTKGIRRFNACIEALTEIEDHLPTTPTLEQLGVSSAGSISHNKQVLSLIAQDQAKDIKPADFQTSSKDETDYLEKYGNLEKLIQSSDDIELLHTYAEKKQIFADLKRITEKHPLDFKMNLLSTDIERYEEYLDCSVKLLENPLSHGTSNATEREQNQFKILSERKKLLESAGVNKPPNEKEKRKNIAHGTIGSARFHASYSLGTGIANYKKGLTKRSVGSKVRLGKVGAKLHTSFFQFSTSAGFGAAKTTYEASLSVPSIAKNKFAPDVSAVALADAYGAKVRAKVTVGSKNINVSFNPEMVVGYFHSGAIAKFGTFQEENSSDKSAEHGFRVGAGYAAAAFAPGLKGSVSFFGIKLQLQGKLYLGGVAARTGIEAKSSGLRMSIAAALGFGGDLELSVDWSGMKNRLMGWCRKFYRAFGVSKDRKLRQNYGVEHVDEAKLGQFVDDDVWSDRAYLDTKGKIKELTEHLDLLHSESTDFTREMIQVARDRLEDLKEVLSNPRHSSDDIRHAADTAMATTVLSNIVRIQEKLGMKKDHSLARAIQSQKHQSAMIQQIIELNNKQPDGAKFWNSSDPEKLKDFLNMTQINSITKHILSPSKNPKMVSVNEKVEKLAKEQQTALNSGEDVFNTGFSL